MRLTLILLAALLAGPASAADLKLYVFDCGWLKTDDISSFSLNGNETPVRELFVPCYLIEHPQGRLLWDAGLPDDIAGQGTVEVQPGATMGLEASIADQLAVLKLTPADIELVAFSHMHYDHVGAANLFTRSHLLIQRTEYEAAFEDPDNPYFQPELYMGIADNERTILDGDHDVFGDGTVNIISAPGHTPGHQVLLLRLENYGPLVLSGDLWHFRASRKLRRAPTFNVDAEQTFQSMDKVDALIERESATLWIEHDKALADTLDKAPAYYD